MARRSLAQRLRQHHSIEHATVNLLSQQFPGLPLIAHSDLRGFVVYGEVGTEVLRQAAEKALDRLQAGDAGLAVHPNCGTNLVTAGMLSGMAAFLAGSGHKRSLWDRIPSAILGATLALILAVPVGRWVQANVTTTGQVAGLRVASVTRLENSSLPYHRVEIVE